MADLSSHGPASFWTQADALLRKNLIFQKRNVKTNIRLTIIPLLLCVLLVVIQTIINNELDKPENKCGCACIDTNGDGQCEQVCGIEYSDLDQAFRCAIPQPPEWPPILQVPEPQYRAVQTDFLSFSDLPNESCKSTGSCPASILLTGNNRTLAQSLALNMFPTSFSFNPNDVWYSLANNVLGSASGTESTNYLEPAFSSDLPVYQVQSQCAQNSTFSVSFPLGSTEIQQDITCVRGLHLWRNSSTEVNDELYYGFRKGNSERKINELIAAYDFLNTSGNNFNLNVWYNASYKNDSGNQPITLTRVPRSINMASNSYLQFLIGPAARMVFEFTKEMPKHDLELRLDFSSLLGPLFFSWVIVQLFPVVLIAIVYEREHRLRIMMKMHGLNDGPYWMISYAYFLVLSSVYMLCFVVFGSVIGSIPFPMSCYFSV
ncbi:ATP-binding cassette [Lithospermum erythrorhizon]|uniref:ATP-binding cassette n=1 Tax=Lithospermum erythrorhizon TaxID=34254 RepID=A0AAV3RRV8_LITER